MPTYTFKHEKTGEVIHKEWTYSQYDNLHEPMKEAGWIRVIVPVAIKDSGSGR